MASGSGGDLDNSTQLQGATDGALIGNNADRIKVDFSASPSGNEPIIPADETNYFFKFLENGGSSELSVNGSSTPVEFTQGPSGSDIWYITQLVIILQDGGNLDATDYGAISGGLTNGLLIEQTNSSTDYEMANVKLNLELAMVFSETSLEGSSQGFLNDANLFIGAFRIEPELSLSGTDSDVIKITVRDNLSSLTLHRAAIRAWMVI